MGGIHVVSLDECFVCMLVITLSTLWEPEVCLSPYYAFVRFLMHNLTPDKLKGWGWMLKDSDRSGAYLYIQKPRLFNDFLYKSAYYVQKS
jgi:hypothetical protein